MNPRMKAEGAKELRDCRFLVILTNSTLNRGSMGAFDPLLITCFVQQFNKAFFKLFLAF